MSPWCLDWGKTHRERPVGTGRGQSLGDQCPLLEHRAARPQQQKPHLLHFGVSVGSSCRCFGLFMLNEATLGLGVWKPHGLWCQSSLKASQALGLCTRLEEQSRDPPGVATVLHVLNWRQLGSTADPGGGSVPGAPELVSGLCFTND